ncbi:MAG: M3 family oligoendopeptidase [Planctomycetota bacterium]|jgi:oligoendopeptidase F|nr:M3 family oligoendopeptidase [Planctomycetota bacterium]
MSDSAICERHPQPPLKFIDEDFVPDSFDKINQIMQQMLSATPSSINEWQDWVQWRSELDSVIAEESLKRMYASVCKTNDLELEKSHLEFQTEIMPLVQPVVDLLDRKYLDCEYRDQLRVAGLEVYDRSLELGVKLFRQENVSLKADDEKLSNEYTRLIGAMTVDYQGEEVTLAGMSKHLASPEREVRKEAFTLVANRRLRNREDLDEVFDKMLNLRHQIGINAGFSNYRDYMHTAKERFDYTPQDCLEFGENVKKYVVPAVKKINEHRRQKLGLEKLRPWDTAVDLDSAPAFEPFTNSDEHVDVAAKLMSCVAEDFGQELRWMNDQGLLDLDTRPHKGPGGFMDTLEKRRVPVIFANSGTTHSDVETLVHEGGHALHSFFARDLEPVDYRMSPLEFAEVASMGLEALAMEHLDEVYPANEIIRARRDSLEGMLSTFVWVATIDGFQHWLYTNPEHTREQRTAAWLRILDEFSTGVDWSGYEDARAAMWHRQLHIFQVPFYYIEYAIAQMGSVQLWLNYRENRAATVAAYRHGLSKGGSLRLPSLFEASGIKFDPQGNGLHEWVPAVISEWQKTV